MNSTRRLASLIIAAYAIAPIKMVAAAQSTGAAKSGMTDLQKRLITSLPVLPWVTLAETRKSQVRGPLQQMIGSHQGYVMVNDGTSVETGGSFINLATASKTGLLGIAGCRMLTLDFDASDKAQLVMLSVDRGWRDKNVAPLIASLTQRYASITAPVIVRDDESEASDFTVLFDIGRFVVETQVPQHGTLLTVTFSTKKLLARLRANDGTIKVLESHLGDLKAD